MLDKAAPAATFLGAAGLSHFSPNLVPDKIDHHLEQASFGRDPQSRINNWAKEMDIKTPVRFKDVPDLGAVSFDYNKGGLVGAEVEGSKLMSRSALGHEMGHVKNVERLANMVGENRIHKVRKVQKAIAGAAKITTPLLSGIAATEEDPSWSSAGINMALHSPKLLDEGMASARAFNVLRKKEGLRGGFKSSKNLIPAFATYAAPALAPAAITGARKLYRKFKGKDNNG